MINENAGKIKDRLTVVNFKLGYQDGKESRFGKGSVSPHLEQSSRSRQTNDFSVPNGQISFGTNYKLKNNYDMNKKSYGSNKVNSLSSHVFQKTGSNVFERPPALVKMKWMEIIVKRINNN